MRNIVKRMGVQLLCKRDSEGVGKWIGELVG